MKNISKKLIAVFIAILTIFGSTIPALAADTNQNYGIETDSAKTNVTLNVEDSEILVSVPKTVVVSGTRDENNKLYKGYYGVKVEGDYAGSEVVSVVPDETVELSQNGKASVNADIVQDKTQWTYDDSGTIANGVISTDKLSAGSWNGKFNFNVSLDKFIPDGYTVLYKYDLSATSSDNVAAYYCVPNENTSPIEIKDDNSPITAAIRNVFMPMTAYAAEQTVIESNGIKYTLSDKDTLVISGNGNMKNEVYADLVNSDLIRQKVEEHFPNVIIHDGYHTLPIFREYTVYSRNSKHNSPENAEFIVEWEKNKIYPTECVPAVKSEKYENTSTFSYWEFDEYKNNTSKIKEISEYIDTIKNDYIVSLPKKVIIQEGVTSIGTYAFKNCETLESVTIPNTVTKIGVSAFAGTGLVDVIIPNSVTDYGASIFLQASKLKSVKLGSGCTKITDSMFQACPSLESIVIPDKVTSIGVWSFMSDSSLKTVYMPKGITKIGGRSFEGCSELTTIYTGETSEGWEKIEGITEQAWPNISTDYFAKATKVYQYTRYGNFTYCVPDSSVKECTVLSYDSNSKNVVIPSSMDGYKVTKLDNTFVNNETIESVVIPNSVKQIDNTFNGCTNLNNVVMSSSLETIGSNVFNNTSNLNSVDIPESCTQIGSYAFAGCSMTSITIPNTVESIGSYAFTNCHSLKRVVIPDSVTSIATRAFSNDENLEYVRMSNSVDAIETYTFANCSSLKTAPLTNNISTIGSYAFSGCSGLTTLTIPDSVTNIGTFAFRDCSNITKLVCGKNAKCSSSAFGSLDGAIIILPDIDIEDYNPTGFGTGTGRTGAIKNCTLYLQSDKHLEHIQGLKVFEDEQYNNRVIVDSSKF